MKTARLLYLLSFASLAVLAAVALDRFLEPSLTYRLLAAEGIAILAGAAGLAHRRAWPAAVVFLPLGAYLLLRTLLPLPAGVQGAAAQAHFYWEALATGASQYLDKFFPLNLSDAPELALLLALALYLFTWLAAFLALSLRQAVAGVALFLVPLGFGLTVGAGARAVPSVVGYIAAATILLALARRIQDPQARPRHLLSRLLIGGALGLTASGLSLLLLTLAPGAAAAPWQDWRVWGSPHQVRSVYVFNWQQNYPRLLDPANKQIIMKVRSPVPTYWRASALDTFTGTTWLASQLFLHSVSPVQSGSTYTYTIPPADLSPAGRPVTEVFQMDSVLTNYLLVGGEPVSIKIDQPLTLRLNDMRALHVSKALGPRFTYTVQAVIPTIKPTDLVGRGREYPEAISRYLNLPFMRISEIPGP
ncbi:MAG: hypothetical protein H5T84_05680, partial [Thermoleophilia bacterium]|nr:hypothetical protein [Thermoleophilia bacterium]